MDAVSLSRLCLASDGRLKANFTDNSVLLVTANGSAFHHKAATGSPFRQLTEFCISRYLPKLVVALQFRNMHWDVPAMCPALLNCITNSDPSAKQCGMTLGYQLAEVWWPRDAQEAWDTGLVQCLADGSLSVSSSDRSARMMLQSNRQRFAVCYPLLYSVHSGQYHYRWHTQVFSLANCPSRWHAALSVLLDIAQQHQEPQQQPLPLPDPASQAPAAACLSTQQEPCTPCHTRSLPAPPHHHHHYQQQQQQQQGSSHALVLAGPQQAPAPATQLPTALTGTRSQGPDGFPADSWWFEPNLTLLPPDDLLLLEWTPEATYEFLIDSGEVQVWLHRENACLTTERQGRFLRFTCCQPAREQRLYEASCVPEYVWLGQPDDVSDPGAGPSRCPLATYAAHALKIRERMCSVLASQEQQPSSPSGARADHDQRTPYAPDTFSAVCDEVLESVNLPNQGSLTAYLDGRVRAFFHDRTIIHLNTSHTHCKVIMPDGRSMVVAVDNPVGVEQHVQILLKFCRWAFQVPEQRAALMGMQALADVQAAASQRMAQLLDWPSRSTCRETDQQQDTSTALSALALPLTLADVSTVPLAAVDMRTQVQELLARNAQLLNCL